MSNESISITDNRTCHVYTLPIEKGTIRAMDLRQVKTGPEDFGLMTYDPAFMIRLLVGALSPSLTVNGESWSIAATL
jgi:hypothetical protein